jgi:hypothetical protein
MIEFLRKMQDDHWCELKKMRGDGEQMAELKSLRGLELSERRRTERRQNCSFRWAEKRTGFDNRRQQYSGGAAILSWPGLLVEALRDRPGLLIKVLLLFNTYNLADYFLTVNALAAGHEELNPVMRGLFAVDPLLAGIFKVLTGLAVTILVWHCRRYRLMLQFSLFAVGVYLALIAYHLYGVFTT